MAALPTWTCPQCTLENEGNRDFCKICNSHKHGKTEGTGGEVSFVKGKPRLLPFVKTPLQWCCPRCNATHDLDNFQCQYCTFIRTNEPQETKISTPKQKPKKRSLMRRFFGSDSDLSGGSFDEPTETKWSCTKCTFANHPSMVVCEACGYKQQKSTNLHRDLPVRSKYDEGKHDLFRHMQSHNQVENVDEYGSCGVTLLPAEAQLWECSACTTINKINLQKCQVCGARFHGSSQVKPHASGNHAPAQPSSQPLESPSLRDVSRQTSDSSCSGLNDLSRMSSRSSEGMVEWNNLSRMSSSQSQEGSSSGSGKKSNQSGFSGWNDLSKTSTDSERGSRPNFSSSSNSPLVHATVTRNPLADIPLPFHRQRSHTKTVLQIRLEEEERAWQAYHEITEEYRKMGETFIDPDFPHSERSLFIVSSAPVLQWEVMDWIRPDKIRNQFFFRSSQPWSVFHNPKPGDIAQGVLGNCWFLSALAVIAEIPDLLEQIIINKQISNEGVYQLRLCKDGQWKVIILDDFFPVRDTGQLVFSQARDRQLWVPLIEKALAKLYGCYEALDGGMIIEGLSCLTGYPCEKKMLHDHSGFGDVDHELIWAELLSLKESKFPMVASCGNSEISKQEFNEVGVHSEHAYSILDVRQIGTQRLIQLRDPWGIATWRSSYLQEQQEPGVFWMGADDFFKYFREVDVCRYQPNWHCERVQTVLHPYAPARMQLIAFQTYVPTQVDVCAYQPSYRGLEATKHSSVDLAVLVLKYTVDGPDLYYGSLPLPQSCVAESESLVLSTVTCSTNVLEPGKYVILPLSFNHWHRPIIFGLESSPRQRWKQEENCVPCVISLSSSQDVNWEAHVPTQPGFLPEALFLLAQKSGSIKHPFSNVSLCEVVLRPSCRVLIAENRNNDLHFTVICNAGESKNLVSSRGELFSQDCIPPMHRQVIMVLTLVDLGVQTCLQLKVEFQMSRHNSNGQWGALHDPLLDEATAELHSPRIIS